MASILEATGDPLRTSLKIESLLVGNDNCIFLSELFSLIKIRKLSEWFLLVSHIQWRKIFYIRILILALINMDAFYQTYKIMILLSHFSEMTQR